LKSRLPTKMFFKRLPLDELSECAQFRPAEQGLVGRADRAKADEQSNAGESIAGRPRLGSDSVCRQSGSAYRRSSSGDAPHGKTFTVTRPANPFHAWTRSTLVHLPIAFPLILHLEYPVAGIVALAAVGARQVAAPRTALAVTVFRNRKSCSTAARDEEHPQRRSRFLWRCPRRARH